ARRRGVGRRAARGGAGRVDRAARTLGGRLQGRRARDGARALAAKRRDRRSLRDGDRGAGGAHRRAGAGALPRALRGDDLRRAGRRQPRAHRPHGYVGPRAPPRPRTGCTRSDPRRPGHPRRDRRRRRGGARRAGGDNFSGRMIFDSHMHVGSFESMFGVSLDRDGIDELMRENEISNGVVFYPDNEYVREVVESIPGLYALAWGNPRVPGNLEEVARLLDHPKFLGLKLHPLIDGYLPNDPSVHPLIELILERDQPVLLHCGHPIFTLPWSIEELAVSFPAAKIVIGHMGHGNVVYI